ncbi:hypothetical protein ATANTOWER_006763 [Ataeniobius toweri]|uniref:Uncharacterized protein n=1 Tax=Ataeniobius toweri TaxID=208326 RepID=A0ABU7BN56_9TELE|nr:hypothetical protein [Ataeniobius toweri]
MAPSSDEGRWGLILGLLHLLDQFRPPIKCGAHFLPATLPASGRCLCPLVYLWFSVSGARCFGGCWLTPGGGLPGPGLLGSVGPVLGERYVPGSRGPWLDLFGRRRLLLGPVGTLLQLPGASALWLLGGSPGTLPCSSLIGVAIVPAVVLLGFLCSGGPLDVSGSHLLRICPASKGAGLGLLTLAIAYFYGETLCTQARSHSDPQVFRLRC